MASTARSKAGKARWANMSAAEKAEALARLEKGRAKRGKGKTPAAAKKKPAAAAKKKPAAAKKAPAPKKPAAAKKPAAKPAAKPRGTRLPTGLAANSYVVLVEDDFGLQTPRVFPSQKAAKDYIGSLRARRAALCTVIATYRG